MKCEVVQKAKNIFVVVDGHYNQVFCFSSECSAQALCDDLNKNPELIENYRMSWWK